MIIDMKSSGETFINPVSYVQKINGQETSISRQKFMFDAKHFNKGPCRISKLVHFEKQTTWFCRARKVTSIDI